MKVLNYIFTIIFFLVFTNTGPAQIIGRCLDSLNQPLPFINIALKNSPTGTVTDENGIFYFEKDLINTGDSLIISHIGYSKKTICVYNTDSIIVVLKPTEYKLKEINVSSTEVIYQNEKMIGTKATTDHVVIGFTSHQLGTEIGKLINVKKGKMYKVEKVFFTISHFDFKKATLRINFYNVDEERNAETERVNVNDFIKEVNNNESVEINVAKEGLLFENDFLVSVEWIDFIHKDSMEIKKDYNLFINSSVFSGPYFRRSNNTMKWRNNKVKYNLGLGIQLLVKY